MDLTTGTLGMTALTFCLCAGVQAAVANPDKDSARSVFHSPPMGFSSWNVGGGSFPRESNAMAVADAMVSRGLLKAGYEYLMAFDGWWWTLEKGSRGSNGVILADADRWPRGIKYVCDYIHSKGLKVAGYGDIGAQGYGDGAGRQWGNYPYYQKDADQLAAWGWDYIKIDDCFAGGDRSKEDAYAEFCSALRNNASQRPIFLSLSTPSTHTSAEFGRYVANMWRTSNDINAPGWASFSRACNMNFDSSEEFWWNQAPGVWNDIDMMVVGIQGLSDAQNRTLFNMWAIRGAPLLIGCDIRTVAPGIIDILTNTEVIAVDQDSLCAQGRKVREDVPNVQVYSKPLGSFTSGERAVLLVNRSAASNDITVHWTDLGLQDGAVTVRDLNAKCNLGSIAHCYTASGIQPGDSVLLKVTGGNFDWSRPREYEAESAYNTMAGSVKHHAYRAGFSSYAYVDGIGRGSTNYLQFNKIAVPRDGIYRVMLAYAFGGETEMVDDMDNRITYGPGWNVFNEGGYYAGTTHYTTSSGAWCELKFTGCSVKWLCKKCPNRGIAEVYIDGKLDATVDCYDTSGAYQAVYSRSGLVSGAHTIRIVTTGRKNTSATETMVDVDAIKIADASKASSVMISVNGGKPSALKLPNTGDENNVGILQTELGLNEGENSVRLFHDTRLVPVIDKLIVLGDKPLSTNSVVFIGTDVKTRGDWIGTYGSQAYSVYGGSAKMPPSMSIRYRHGEWDAYFSQGSDEAGLGLKTHEAASSDPRALLKPGGGRTTSCIYRDNSFTLDVDTRDGAVHQVAFYLLDWDKAPRSARIEAYDGDSNRLLGTREVVNAGEGRYVLYKVEGHVKFKFSRLSGTGVAISSVFIDPWNGGSPR